MIVTVEQVKACLHPRRGWANLDAIEPMTLVLASWVIDEFGEQAVTESCVRLRCSWIEAPEVQL